MSEEAVVGTAGHPVGAASDRLQRSRAGSPLPMPCAWRCRGAPSCTSCTPIPRLPTSPTGASFLRVRRTLADWGLLEQGSAPRAVFERLGVRLAKIRVHDRDAVRAILRFLAEHPSDIIVLATQGRDGLPRWLHGSVAEPVARAGAHRHAVHPARRARLRRAGEWRRQPAPGADPGRSSAPARATRWARPAQIDPPARRRRRWRSSCSTSATPRDCRACRSKQAHVVDGRAYGPQRRRRRADPGCGRARRCRSDRHGDRGPSGLPGCAPRQHDRARAAPGALPVLAVPALEPVPPDRRPIAQAWTLARPRRAGMIEPSHQRRVAMAVARVTKITASSTKGFQEAVNEGLTPRGEHAARDHRPRGGRAEGQGRERQDHRVPGDDRGDVRPRLSRCCSWARRTRLRPSGTQKPRRIGALGGVSLLERAAPACPTSDAGPNFSQMTRLSERHPLSGGVMRFRAPSCSVVLHCDCNRLLAVLQLSWTHY